MGEDYVEGNQGGFKKANRKLWLRALLLSIPLSIVLASTPTLTMLWHRAITNWTINAQKTKIQSLEQELQTIQRDTRNAESIRDVNNDGLKDIIYRDSTGKLMVRYASQDGYSKPREYHDLTDRN